MDFDRAAMDSPQHVQDTFKPYITSSDQSDFTATRSPCLRRLGRRFSFATSETIEEFQETKHDENEELLRVSPTKGLEAHSPFQNTDGVEMRLNFPGSPSIRRRERISSPIGKDSNMSAQNTNKNNIRLNAQGSPSLRRRQRRSSLTIKDIPNNFEHDLATPLPLSPVKGKERRGSLVSIESSQTNPNIETLPSSPSVRRKERRSSLTSLSVAETDIALILQCSPSAARKERRSSLTTKDIRETLKKSNERSNILPMTMRSTDVIPVIAGKIIRPQNSEDDDYPEGFVPRQRRVSLPTIDTQGFLNNRPKKDLKASLVPSDKPLYTRSRRSSMPVLDIGMLSLSKESSKTSICDDDEEEAQSPLYNRSRRGSLPPISSVSRRGSILVDELMFKTGSLGRSSRRRDSLSENDLNLVKNFPSKPVPQRRNSLHDFGTYQNLNNNASRCNLNDMKDRRQSLPHNIAIPNVRGLSLLQKDRQRRSSILDHTTPGQQYHMGDHDADNDPNMRQHDDHRSDGSASSMTALQDQTDETENLSDDTVLPPRTPEPEVLQEFKSDKPDSGEKNDNVYQPRYCWCTRCQLMYRMFKDDDERLENWGNYPCFHF